MFVALTFALIWQSMEGSYSAAMSPAAAGVSNQVELQCVVLSLTESSVVDHCDAEQ